VHRQSSRAKATLVFFLHIKQNQDLPILFGFSMYVRLRTFLQGLKPETHVQPYDSRSQMCIPLPQWKHIRGSGSQQRQGPQLRSFSAELHLKLAVWGARAQMLFLEFSRPRSVSHGACKHREGRKNLTQWTCKIKTF